MWMAYLNFNRDAVLFRGVLGGVCGGLNLVWPRALPKKYYKVTSRVADCFLYVPWVLQAAEQMDKLIK